MDDKQGVKSIWVILCSSLQETDQPYGKLVSLTAQLLSSSFLTQGHRSWPIYTLIIQKSMPLNWSICFKFRPHKLRRHLTIKYFFRFRQYGLWERYTDLHPTEDLVYTVGFSNYQTDWFFAHVHRYLFWIIIIFGFHFHLINI